MTTMADAKMSERLLDLEDIIRPIAIEETRRYLDSRNLLTKEDFDVRIKSVKEDLKEHFDERFKRVDEQIGRVNDRITHIQEKLSDKIDSTETNLTQKIGAIETNLILRIDGIQTSLMLRFILTMAVLLGLAVGAIGVMISAKTITSTSATSSVQTEASSNQAR